MKILSEIECRIWWMSNVKWEPYPKQVNSTLLRLGVSTEIKLLYDILGWNHVIDALYQKCSVSKLISRLAINDQFDEISDLSNTSSQEIFQQAEILLNNIRVIHYMRGNMPKTIGKQLLKMILIKIEYDILLELNLVDRIVAQIKDTVISQYHLIDLIADYYLNNSKTNLYFLLSYIYESDIPKNLTNITNTLYVKVKEQTRKMQNTKAFV